MDVTAFPVSRLLGGSDEQRGRRPLRLAEEGGDAADLDAIDQLFAADAHDVHRHLTGHERGAAVDERCQQAGGGIDVLVAHHLAHQPAAFLLGVALDGGIGIASLWCLIRIVTLEQHIAEGGK